MKPVTVIVSFIAFLALVNVVSAESPPPHPDQIEFNFKWQPGHTYTQKIVSRTVGACMLPPPWPEQKISQTMEETLVVRCVKVNDDGSGEFEMTIDGLAMKMTIGGLSIKYDSRTYDPKAQTDWVTAFVSKIFNAMNGTSFTTTLSPTGRALKIEGLSSALKKMAASIGNSKDEAVAKSMLDQISSTMDDDMMNQEIQSLYRILPGEPGPYKIGDKWEHTWGFKLPVLRLGMKGLGRYELAGFETIDGRPCAKILTYESVELSTPDPNDKNPSPEAAKNPALEELLRNMDLKLSTSGGAGYAYVDYRTGEVVRVRGSQGMKLVMTVKPDPSGKSEREQRGTEITQTFRINISADLVEPGNSNSATKPSDVPAEASKP